VYWRGVLLTNDNQDIFGDLFVITGNTVCLDPKDKVFSMLEIYRVCTGQSHLFVEPDYRQSVEEIMINAARSIIVNMKDLNVLRLACQNSWRRTSLLPSWVPDWRKGMPHQLLRQAVAPVVRNEPLDVGFENDYRSLRVRGFEIDEIDCGVHIDFSTKYAFVQSVLACIELCHHSLDWHSCARAASWLAILYIVDPFQYHSYHISRASIDAAAQSDPLDPANFPPRTLDAASRLAETYWVWHGDDSSDLSRSMHSTIRRSIRKEGVFTTKNGSYVAATAMANKGDIVVAFPRTFCLLALRKVGGHRFVVGPV
jgi:hypothetical protein